MATGMSDGQYFAVGLKLSVGLTRPGFKYERLAVVAASRAAELVLMFPHGKIT